MGQNKEKIKNDIWPIKNVKMASIKNFEIEMAGNWSKIQKINKKIFLGNFISNLSMQKILESDK